MEDASDPRPSELAEGLAARVLAHIKDDRLPPDTHLSAQNLADRFCVSRSPVTLALRLLLAKGVLVHKPNRGYFLAADGQAQVDAVDFASPDRLGTVYFQLADDRLQGRLPAQVSETLLRERYSLTRAQLGSLLTRIAQEGWAQRRPGYGWEFSEMLTTPEALVQTYRVRLALEPAALLEPGYRLAPETIQRLRAAEVRLLDGALETDPPDALHERGVRFHESVLAGSRNPFFLEALRRINRVRRLLSYRSMIVRDRYRDQCRDHLEILALLEAGRVAEGSLALRAHLERTIDNLDRIRPLMES
ncbi:MAG: GntR family transcriptional regulator [Geminicoccaceae bacterium]